MLFQPVSKSRPSNLGSIFLVSIVSILLLSCGDSGGKILTTGQALLGPLCGATVELFHADDLKTAIYATTTEDAANLTIGGTFEIPVWELEDRVGGHGGLLIMPIP